MCAIDHVNRAMRMLRSRDGGDAMTDIAKQIEQVEIDLAKASRLGLKQDVATNQATLEKLYAAEKRGETGYQ